MKRNVMLLLAALLALAGVVSSDTAMLGTLTRDSAVMVEGLYPVFWIWVPDGTTEIQIRASVNNFQNGFTVGGFPDRYACTGTKNGKNYYEVAEDPAASCSWKMVTGGFWAWSLVLPNHVEVLTLDNVMFPWEAFPDRITKVTEKMGRDDLRFCYFWCTTGENDFPLWGTGIVDGAAEMFISSQKGSEYGTPPTEFSSLSMQRLLTKSWDAYVAGYPDSSMTAQLQTGGTPGHYVLFQPSRSAHLFQTRWGDWMRQNNKYLQWVAQFETPAGWETHPDGTPLWNVMRPVEWRTSRTELLEPK